MGTGVGGSDENGPTETPGPGQVELGRHCGRYTEEKIFKEIQQIELKGFKDRVGNVRLNLHFGVLLKTGQATDEDMQSLASMFSTQTLGETKLKTKIIEIQDIGNLDDFRIHFHTIPAPIWAPKTMDALKFQPMITSTHHQLELPRYCHHNKFLQ